MVFHSSLKQLLIKQSERQYQTHFLQKLFLDFAYLSSLFHKILVKLKLFFLYFLELKHLNCIDYQL